MFVGARHARPPPKLISAKVVGIEGNGEGSVDSEDVVVWGIRYTLTQDYVEEMV